MHSRSLISEAKPRNDLVVVVSIVQILKKCVGVLSEYSFNCCRIRYLFVALMPFTRERPELFRNGRRYWIGFQ
jgi:hypothetical protein